MGVLSGGLSTLSQGRPPEPTIILNEFCLTTRYRKYAIRLLNGPAPEEQRVRRPRGRKPRYSKAVLSGGGVGSGGLSVVGAAEGPAAELVAVDS